MHLLVSSPYPVSLMHSHGLLKISVLYIYFTPLKNNGFSVYNQF